MKNTLKKAGYDKVQKQMNDVFLQFTAKVVFFIVIMFSFNLFFAGHYTPGGGFVGGLLAAAALILLLIHRSSHTSTPTWRFRYSGKLPQALIFDRNRHCLCTDRLYIGSCLEKLQGAWYRRR